MLYIITLLTATAVAALYPLCFWISCKEPLKQGFHRFHIGLPLVLCGILNVFIIYKHFPLFVSALTMGWFIIFALIAMYYWSRDYPDVLAITLPVMMGIAVYGVLQTQLIGYSFPKIFIGLLGGLIFCAALFAMNLGHWYLNVHGLPVAHLVRSTKLLGALLVIRLGWDFSYALAGTTLHQGVTLKLYQFMLTLDGFLLWVGVFFGSLFPLFSLYFVLGTLKVKNTQSATGILYVTLCSVLLGDMAYKYYLIKFGVAL